MASPTAATQHRLWPVQMTAVLLLGLLVGSPALPDEGPAGHENDQREHFLNLYRKNPNLTQAAIANPQVLGKPDRKSRQVLFRGYFEQWIYDPPLGLVLEFACGPGQEPRLTSVHLLRKAKL